MSEIVPKIICLFLKLDIKIFFKRSLGYVYRNNVFNITINLQNNQNNTLYIVVENMGRLNFGDDLHDSKVNRC